MKSWNSSTAAGSGASEHENSFDALEGKMIIVDLSDENGPDFRVAKILRRTQDGNFEIHYYETRDRKAALSRKKFPIGMSPIQMVLVTLKNALLTPATLL